ncbi:hypothetical protein CY35_13G073700 [Sphagnum magellanicum]|nr:hypothetical protein CY35_13G073700 [Sphagnum magellanicum]
MGSYEPALKKSRLAYSDTGAPGTVNLAAMSNGSHGVALGLHATTAAAALDLQAMSMQINGDQECRRYNSPEGCPYGSSCRFKHGPTGGIAALPGLMMPMTASAAGTGTCLYSATSGGGGGGWGPGLNNLGTEISTGGGPPGSLYACSTAAAAADPATTSVGSFKTRLCNRFSMPDGCRFGERCHFAHGESDLRPSNGISSLHSNGFEYMASAEGYANGAGTLMMTTPVPSTLYYEEPTPPGVTATTNFCATSNTKMGIEAVFAGAIIGKAGANVKQISRLTGAKLSIREHETDVNMRNVEMEGTYEQIEHATEMVRQFLQQRAEVTVPQRAAVTLSSHNFKTKLCENYTQGTCTFADHCHFAHGIHELRSTNRLR